MSTEARRLRVFVASRFLDEVQEDFARAFEVVCEDKMTQAVVDAIGVGDTIDSIDLEGQEAVLAAQSDRVSAWSEVLG